MSISFRLDSKSPSHPTEVSDPLSLPCSDSRLTWVVSKSENGRVSGHEFRPVLYFEIHESGFFVLSTSVVNYPFSFGSRRSVLTQGRTRNGVGCILVQWRRRNTGVRETYAFKRP